MFRLLLAIFLFGLYTGVTAQEVKIRKSTDLVVIRGKSYYLHTVQPGQTLYSICKAYGITVEELKKMNDKRDDALSLYEVLKIPYVETYVRQDDKYYYHKVVKGETIYSLARRFGIKPKRLLKHNSDYSSYRPLAVGSIVKLPLQEIDRSALPKVVQENKEEVHAETLCERVVDDKKPVNMRDTVVQSNDDILKAEDAEETPAFDSEVAMPSESFVKVALILPLFTKEYPVYQDSLPEFQLVQISSRSEQFVCFYEGILLAVDSLKKMGCQIDLHVFDSEKNAEKMRLLAGELNRLAPDLIIGPVYASVAKVLVENMVDKNVPLIYPLSVRGEALGGYANVVQVNASFEVLVKEMADWLIVKSDSANIVHVRTSSEGSGVAEKQVLREQLGKVAGMHSFAWNIGRMPLDSLKTLLRPDRENILVIPTAQEAEVSKILPVLSALTADYRISVVGLPEWQQFSSVDFENYYKLNTHLFTYSHVDYASESAKCLAEKYRKYFYSEPTTLVYKAYDMGMYFMELADKYRGRLLEALEHEGKEKDFSLFCFDRMPNRMMLENQAFYIVRFSSDYQIKVQASR